VSRASLLMRLCKENFDGLTLTVGINRQKKMNISGHYSVFFQFLMKGSVLLYRASGISIFSRLVSALLPVA
jgi:hypothetical protein